MLTKGQQIVALVLSLLALATAINAYYTEKAREAVEVSTYRHQQAAEMQRDREHIRALERMVVAQHPDYTEWISWDDK